MNITIVGTKNMARGIGTRALAGGNNVTLIGHEPLCHVVVIGGYRQVDGIVTLEDVREQFAGDITDEYDAAGTTAVRQPGGTFLVDAV